MIFHGFYNLKHVGDILLARCGEGRTFDYDKYDDLVVLKDSKNRILGFNLLNASNYLGELNTGLVNFSDNQIEKFNELYKDGKIPENIANSDLYNIRLS